MEVQTRLTQWEDQGDSEPAGAIMMMEEDDAAPSNRPRRAREPPSAPASVAPVPQTVLQNPRSVAAEMRESKQVRDVLKPETRGL